MKTGDKVVFLNATGGGIIVGFPDKDTVSVRDETGFDIPMLKSEVVVVEQAMDKATAPDNEVAAKKRAIHHTGIKKNTTLPITDEHHHQLNLSIAYLRELNRTCGIQNYQAYLINDSDYYAQFLLAEVQDQHTFVRHTDIVEPHTKLYLETFDEQHINAQEHLLVQAFFYQTTAAFRPKLPLSIEVKTEGSKFLKANTFKKNDFFNEPALIVPLIKDDQPCTPLQIDGQRLTEALLSQGHTPTAPTSVARPSSAASNDPLEVDLHADQLLSSMAGMQPKDILDYQLKIFHDTMRQYASKKGKRIVFIHGKGNGVLRKAILDQLKQHYRTCAYQDADFQEYGFGATLVTIR